MHLRLRYPASESCQASGNTVSKWPWVCSCRLCHQRHLLGSLQLSRMCKYHY